MIITSQPFRPTPKAPSWAYKTYVIKAPLRTHWRKATCKEVECKAFREGWKTVVPVDSPQAQYIRAHAGRAYTETRATHHDSQGNELPLVGMTCFDFPPGEQPFASEEHDNHRISLERDPLFIVRGGDYRGNPTGYRRRHTKPEFWVEDFANHQQHRADLQNKYGG
jgi:hypothetical protein